MKSSSSRHQLFVIGCLILLSLLDSMASAGNLFSGPINSPAGRYPYALAAGDFNGDGKIDLAVTNNNFQDNVHQSVKILLGEGTGIFQPPVDYRVGAWPVSVAVGDFNADGTLDLAVLNQRKPFHRSGNLSVLLGNGDGTFQPQVTYKLGRYPNMVAVGDFNGDGKPDLAIANLRGNGQKPGFTQILLGNGDGTFQSGIRTYAGKSPAGVALGDLNGDGILDLVVFDLGYIPSEIYKARALLGNGDGTFTLAWTSENDMLQGAALGDFNGDGKLDLAAIEFAGSRVRIRLGNGDGTFGKPTDYPANFDAQAIVIADFDRDGNLDVAVANQSSHDVSVLLGNGDGTFQPTTNYPLAFGARAVQMVAADVNGDERLDLVVTDHFNKVVSALVNTGRR